MYSVYAVQSPDVEKTSGSVKSFGTRRLFVGPGEVVVPGQESGLFEGARFVLDCFGRSGFGGGKGGLTLKWMEKVWLMCTAWESPKRLLALRTRPRGAIDGLD